MKIERAYMFVVIVVIVLSIPSFFIEVIPRPYDWAVKLTTHVIGRMLPLIPLIYFFRRKGFILFAGATLLLFPQAISDCGLLHKFFPGFTESVFDWYVSGLILVLYIWALFLLVKELYFNNKKE